MTRDATQPPSPHGGWSLSAVTEAQALVAPPSHVDGVFLETAVFSTDNQPISMAATWRRDTLITVPPKQMPEPSEALSGKWLWGGVLYHHFGHFQVETLSRMWALRRFRDEIRGLIFVSRDGKDTLRSFEADYFQLLGCDLPIHVCTQPTRIEELVIPGQGFGLGGIASGTRVFRRFIHEDFAKEVKPKGSENLFISRSKQPLDKGGFLGEMIIDARMKAAGYDVFWPEDHSLKEQIARYKAAKRIVALDGSALHLFAMVGRSDQRVAMILRRDRVASRSLRKHITRFTGEAPVVINALRADTERFLGKKRLITALDFAHIGRVLSRRGFIEDAHNFGPIKEEELAQIIA